MVSVILSGASCSQQTVMGINRMLVDEVNGNGRHCDGLNDVG